jgi:hypothetical protein
MIKRFKRWLCERFLPSWAADTLARDNEHLRQMVAEQRAEINALNAYINGMQRALHEVGRMTKGGGET